MKNLILLVTIFLTSEIFAQSTLIEYNFHDETYVFYKITRNGKKVETKKPFGYAGVPVKFVVKDMNTACYNVSFETQSYEQKPENSEANVQSLISGYTASTSGENQSDGGGSNFTALMTNGVFQPTTGHSGAFGMAAGEFEKEFEMLDAQSVLLDEANTEMVKSSKKIASIMDYIQIVEFTNRELLKLINNSNLKEADLKKRATDLTMKVLDNSTEMEQVLIVSNSKTSELQKEIGEYIKAYNTFQYNAELLKHSISIANERVKNENFKMTSNNLSKQVEDRKLNLDENYEDLQGLLTRDINSEMRTKLMEVYNNFDNIMNTDFNYDYTLNSDKDVTRITMEFVRPIVDSTKVIKTRYLDIPTQGGMRVNSSAGMSFATYFGGQNTYFNNNGIIGEETGDVFIPTLTTMFHFYRQTYKPFALGGSFGLSVPLEGEKDFMYMTGLSGILGKSQRVIFNAGVFGGRVNRLDQQLRSGDALTSIYSEVPVKKVFDFGVYIGLSFNISSLF